MENHHAFYGKLTSFQWQFSSSQTVNVINIFLGDNCPIQNLHPQVIIYYFHVHHINPQVSSRTFLGSVGGIYPSAPNTLFQKVKRIPKKNSKYSLRRCLELQGYIMILSSSSILYIYIIFDLQCFFVPSNVSMIISVVSARPFLWGDSSKFQIDSKMI